MGKHHWTICVGLMGLFASVCHGQARPVVKVGAGSYTTQLPAGAKEPPETMYKTENVRGPAPTGDWCSSLLWMKHSERQYAHPLAVRALEQGLQVYYPGTSIVVIPVGIIAGMPEGGRDLVIGHSTVESFPDARLDDYSDWFVTAAFSAGGAGMKLTYGHGSPFVYGMYQGGEPKISFAEIPAVWSGNAQSSALGLSIGGRHYALFGPSGCTWAGLGTKALVCKSGGKAFFSMAVLPDKEAATLELFKKYAHCHVAGSKVGWSYDAKSSSVATQYTFSTVAREGENTGTLFAMYPHQWRNAQADLTGHEYASVRGVMKLARGTAFSTRMIYPGVLPALPDVGGMDAGKLRQYVGEEAGAAAPPLKDTYWEGKYLGKLVGLVPLAQQAGDEAAARKFLDELKRRMEIWLSAGGPDGKARASHLFYYNRNWGTLIGYPASYGSDVELNDHHFHYGYFLRAAAEIARNEPAWAAEERWGGMLRLLARDIASSDRKDVLFPFLRNFDPYAGHSWASGHARFADGNNQESSSEAMNAWCALILLGDAIGDVEMRDLGIYLFTTEMYAINAYWFDVLGDNRPSSYKPPVVTMIWGAKSVNETWFGNKPEQVHTINWLPFHGGSLYLGLYPEYVKQNYEGMVAAKGGDNWEMNADLIWMYRALYDAEGAMGQFAAVGEKTKIEPGNSRAFTYQWLCALKAMGRVDRTVTADWPTYAVLTDGHKRTHIVYNGSAAEKTVRFSDGVVVVAKPRGFAVGRNK